MACSAAEVRGGAEWTKALIDRAPAERTAAAIPSAAVTVPATLHASLMARLDRLGGPAKEVAQIGAAIGREFTHALLAAIARKPEPALQSALDRLIEGGLLFRQGVQPHATYLFKHALVQEAAYGTLLREPRRALHARNVWREHTRNSADTMTHGAASAKQ